MPPDPTTLNRAFGARVTLSRQQHGLSVEDLAARIHVAAEDVKEIEAGTRLAGATRSLAIADALGITVMELFGQT